MCQAQLFQTLLPTSFISMTLGLLATLIDTCLFLLSSAGQNVAQGAIGF